jgi:hypothetical protein
MKRNFRKLGETPRPEIDDILPEYDFSRARPNKYASRYEQRTSVVALDPDVAAVFQNPGEVNEALRALAHIINKHQSRRKTLRRNSRQPKARVGDS